MNHKYIVTLADEERDMLWDLIAKGRTQGYRIKHTQILLKLNEIPENREWTYDKTRKRIMPHHINLLAQSADTDILLHIRRQDHQIRAMLLSLPDCHTSFDPARFGKIIGSQHDAMMILLTAADGQGFASQLRMALHLHGSIVG